MFLFPTLHQKIICGSFEEFRKTFLLKNTKYLHQRNARIQSPTHASDYSTDKGIKTKQTSPFLRSRSSLWKKGRNIFTLKDFYMALNTIEQQLPWNQRIVRCGKSGKFWTDYVYICVWICVRSARVFMCVYVSIAAKHYQYRKLFVWQFFFYNFIL